MHRSPLAAIAALLLVPAGAAAGEPTMPLSEVRPGMRCEGRTVVKGTEPASFDVLVEDVVDDDPGAEAARLLVRVSGPAVDATGVGQGFSGSPVICDGRIAGAISEAVGDFGGRLALATPIEYVLREPADAPAGRDRFADGARARSARRTLAGPLTVSGVSGPVAAALRRAGGRRLLAVAPAAPRRDVAAGPLRPGSAVAAGLASGDVTAGAVGTVAYVDGDRVWAFGHPLDAAGRRSLLLQSAYVYAVVGNPAGTEEAGTYKLAAPLRDVGAVTNDGTDAVVGRAGAPPRVVPLRVRATDRDAGRERVLDVTLADETAVGLPTGQSPLSAVGPVVVAQAAYTAMRGTPARASAEMCARFTFEGLRRPVRLCNRYVGGLGGAADLTGAPAAADLAEAAATIDAFEGPALRLRGASVGLDLRRGLRLARLAAIEGPRVVRRGRRAALVLHLRVVHTGERLRRRVRVPIPRAAPRGERDLVLTGTPADDAAAGEELELELDSILDLAPEAQAVSAPRTLRGLARSLRRLERWDGITGRLVPPGAGADPEDPGFRAHRADDLRVDGEARVRLRIR